MSDKTYDVPDTASNSSPVMNFTEAELKSWLQKEYEARPMSSSPQPGEYTRMQIQEMLGLGDNMGKKFVHSMVLQGKMTMRRAGSLCFYKKVETGT